MFRKRRKKAYPSCPDTWAQVARTGLVQKIVQLHSQGENQSENLGNSQCNCKTEHSDKRPKTSAFVPASLPLPHTCDLIWRGGSLRPNNRARVLPMTKSSGIQSGGEVADWLPACAWRPFCLRGHANQLASPAPAISLPWWSPPRTSSACAHKGAEKEVAGKGPGAVGSLASIILHHPKPRQQSFHEAKTLTAHKPCASQHRPFTPGQATCPS